MQPRFASRFEIFLLYGLCGAGVGAIVVDMDTAWTYERIERKIRIAEEKLLASWLRDDPQWMIDAHDAVVEGFKGWAAELRYWDSQMGDEYEESVGDDPTYCPVLDGYAIPNFGG